MSKAKYQSSSHKPTYNIINHKTTNCPIAGASNFRTQWGRSQPNLEGMRLVALQLPLSPLQKLSFVKEILQQLMYIIRIDMQ